MDARWINTLLPDTNFVFLVFFKLNSNFKAHLSPKYLLMDVIVLFIEFRKSSNFKFAEVINIFQSGNVQRQYYIHMFTDTDIIIEF